MSINPMYMIASSIQEYFVDKDTGLPLSGGIVSFWEDENRTVPKAVYTLTGSPPNYTYAALPNPLTLSAVGTPQYNGNDIVIYYYPFDINGNVELYYITVVSSDFTPQEVRQAWPNFSLESNPSSGQEIFNYIPNPQFLMHNNLPYDGTVNPALQAGQIRQAITQIAPGGWTFERPSSSTALDYVTFFRYGSFVDEPTQSPRYALQVNTTSPDITDSFKNICVNFSDVNKFTDNPSPSVTNQVYTFYFEAQTMSSANFDVTIKIIKNFGTGGSSPVTLAFNTVTITNSVTSYHVTLDFGQNSSYTIGDLNDDYVQVVLSLPTNIGAHAIYTNFLLTINNITVNEFPTTTDKDMIARTMVPPVPDPNGFDLYLQLVQGPNGYLYDDSCVGQIYATTLNTVGPAELLLNGQTLLVSGYSPFGIPYQRLFNKWINVPTGIPLFGTGPTFVTCYTRQPTGAYLTLMTNQSGTQTAAADGLVPTTFTFSQICSGTASYGFTPYFAGNSNQLFISCNTRGVVATSITSSSAAITASIIRNGQNNNGIQIEGVNQGIKQILWIVINSIPAAGSYFTLGTTTQSYYVWFKLNGTGTDPAPGGIGIPVNLISGMSLDDVAKSIYAAVLATTASNITIVPGSSITPNSYWTFYANGQLWVVWYSLNGTGIQPIVSNAKYIAVNYQTSDSIDLISQKTLDAINRQYFYIPDFRGLFLRGIDPTNNWDIDVFMHMSQNAQNIGMVPGTIEIDSLISHYHTITEYTGTGSIPNITPNRPNQITADTQSTNYTGGDETRGVSMGINWLVKI